MGDRGRRGRWGRRGVMMEEERSDGGGKEEW